MIIMNNVGYGLKQLSNLEVLDLDISSNKIGYIGIEGLTIGLKNKPKLNQLSLNISNCFI